MAPEGRSDGVRGPVIVGCVDRSQTWDAVELGRALAEGLDARLLVACAYPSDLSPSPVPSDELRGQAEELLSGVLARLPSGLDVDACAAPASSPARGLHELAEVEEAAALVLGSSHRGAAGRVFAGNVAQRLLAGSSCPVAVAPEGFGGRGTEGLDTIGVGFDDGPDAWNALQRAAALAATTGASIRILCALEPPGWLSASLPRPEAGLEERRRRAEVAVSRAVTSVSSSVRPKGDVVVGTAVEVLESEAGRGLDLLVVGSRGYGPVRRVLLGSVSSELMRVAPCPVMVVPRTVEFDSTAGGLAGRD